MDVGTRPARHVDSRSKRRALYPLAFPLSCARLRPPPAPPAPSVCLPVRYPFPTDATDVSNKSFRFAVT